MAGMTWEAATRDAASLTPRVRANAAQALCQVEEPQQAAAAALLLGLLQDRDEQVRTEAALALGELHWIAALEPLATRARQDPEPGVRQAAVIALGGLGDERATPLLAELLQASLPDVRFQAVAALAQVATPDEAQAPLERALQDPDPEVRGSAAAALGDLGVRGSVEPLVGLLTDPLLSVRVEAAVALARLGDRRGHPLLGQLLHHREYGLLAAEQLFRWPDPTALPHLRQVRERWFVPPLLKVWTAAALARLGDATGRDQLVRSLKSRQPLVCGLAIQLLGELGGSWACTALEQLARSSGGARWREELDDALRQARLADRPHDQPEA